MLARWRCLPPRGVAQLVNLLQLEHEYDDDERAAPTSTPSRPGGAGSVAAEAVPTSPPDAPLNRVTFEAGPLGLLLKESSLGLMVVAVRPGGAAATRGVAPGDVVAEINDQRVVRDETEAAFGARVKAAGRPLNFALRRSPPGAAEVIA